MNRLFCLKVVGAATLLTGCGGNDFQSALHPVSDEARAISSLWWMMVVVYGGVFFITMGLAARALFSKRSDEAPGGSVRFVVIAGIVVPSIILLAMLVVSLRTSAVMRAPETTMTIEVVGHQWWWDVRYSDFDITTANEIRIPAGVAVGLELGSGDVIHSFWIPNLHGKMDMIPDHGNRFWIRADEPGSYRGICAEFCGDQHALMGIDVVVMSPEDFERWVNERRDIRVERSELFSSAGCAACHAINGTDAIGNVGPDLTHLADRRTLGASTLPNNREMLRRWIVDPQGIKPGNLMPATHLSGDELERLLDYLMTLK